MIKKLRPLDNRVVIEPEKPDEKSPGGIVLPETSGKNPPRRGTVVEVGPGKLLPSGERRGMLVKVGDCVLLDWGGTEVEVDRKKYFVITDDNIMAVVE